MSQPDSIIDHLLRYPSKHHDELIRTVVLSTRVAQLAIAHPLLFLLLSTGYGTAQERTLAMKRADGGRPLIEICAALSVPMSLRRIPPESCGPLPRATWSERASRELAPLIPRTADAAAHWLQAVFRASAVADEPFGLWVARQRQWFIGRVVPERPLTAIALYAWCSRFSPLPLDHSLAAPWEPDFSVDTTCQRAALWARELTMVSHLTPGGLASSWVRGATIAGLSFVPLLSADDLLSEGRQMNNCIANYSDRLWRGTSRLFSLRDGERHVATLEIGYIAEREEYVVREVLGPNNVKCPLGVVQACYDWLVRCAPSKPPAPPDDPGKAASLLSALLAPYCDAHPTMTLQATKSAHDMLHYADMVRTELWFASRPRTTRAHAA